MAGTGERAPEVLRRAAPLAAALLCALGAACTGGAGSGGGAASPPPAPEPLERIAAALRCAPEVTVDAEEVREGACAVDAQAFRLATFSTARGRDAWLAQSRQYGGTYLVGERWIITAPSADALARARTRLGGTLESGPAHPHGAGAGPVPRGGAASGPGHPH